MRLSQRRRGVVVCEVNSRLRFQIESEYCRSEYCRSERVVCERPIIKEYVK